MVLHAVITTFAQAALHKIQLLALDCLGNTLLVSIKSKNEVSTER